MLYTGMCDINLVPYYMLNSQLMVVDSHSSNPVLSGDGSQLIFTADGSGEDKTVYFYASVVFN